MSSDNQNNQQTLSDNQNDNKTSTTSQMVSNAKDYLKGVKDQTSEKLQNIKLPDASANKSDGVLRMEEAVRGEHYFKAVEDSQ